MFKPISYALVTLSIITVSAAGFAATPQCSGEEECPFFPEPGFINKDITIQVPSVLNQVLPGNCGLWKQLDTVQDALYCIAPDHIAADKTVTIEVTQDGIDYEPIAINHPQGSQIQLIGNCDGGRACMLKFSGQGVSVIRGHSLGLIQNLVFVGGGAGSNSTYGMLVDKNSTVTLGNNITIENFGIGLASYYGSSLGVYGQAKDQTSTITISKNRLGMDVGGASGVEMYGVTLTGNNEYDIKLGSNSGMNTANVHVGKTKVLLNGSFVCGSNVQFDQAPAISAGGQTYQCS